MVCPAMRGVHRSFPNNKSRGWYATASKYKTAGFEAAHGLRWSYIVGRVR